MSKEQTRLRRLPRLATAQAGIRTPSAKHDRQSSTTRRAVSGQSWQQARQTGRQGRSRSRAEVLPKTALTFHAVREHFCRGPARPFLPGRASPDLKCNVRMWTLEDPLLRGHVTPARDAPAESTENGQRGAVGSAISAPEDGGAVDLQGVEGVWMWGSSRRACQLPWSACSRGHTLLSMWSGDRDMQGGAGVAKGEQHRRGGAQCLG